MTRPTDRAQEMLEQSGIPEEGSEQLIECLAALERSVPDTAPEPGPELAALMARTSKAVVVAPFARRRRRVLIAGAVAFGTVAAGGIAAAANELPSGAQDVVAEFSERFLPFDLPRPDVRPDRGDDGSPEQPIVPVDATPGLQTPGGEDPSITPTEGPTSGASPSTAPSSAPSPSSSALPSPGAVDPTQGTELPPAPEETAAPDEQVTEEPVDGDPQAAPEGDATSAPTSGDSTETGTDPGTDSGTDSGATEPEPSPSPSGGSGPLNSRRTEGMDHRPDGKEKSPRSSQTSDVWGAG